MARIKFAYVGGGSSRAAGTMASLLAHGKEFDGSHVVLIDQRQDRLDLVETIARKLVGAQGLDITVETTTDQRAGLTDVDAVLSSYRPGGFEMRQAGRDHPDAARRDRPGDPGSGRDDDVVPLDRRRCRPSSTTSTPWPRGA